LLLFAALPFLLPKRFIMAALYAPFQPANHGTHAGTSSAIIKAYHEGSLALWVACTHGPPSS
jgi:hypothetical protein